MEDEFCQETLTSWHIFHEYLLTAWNEPRERGHSIKSKTGMLIWTDFLSSQKMTGSKFSNPKKTELFLSPHNYPFCTTS